MSSLFGCCINPCSKDQDRLDFRKIEDNGEVIYCAALYDGHGVSATVADLAQDNMLAHIEAELQKIGFNDLSEKVKTQVAWAICNAMCSCVRVFTQSNTPGTAHTSVCAYVYLGDQRARGITFFGSNYTASHGTTTQIAGMMNIFERAESRTRVPISQADGIVSSVHNPLQQKQIRVVVRIFSNRAGSLTSYAELSTNLNNTSQDDGIFSSGHNHQQEIK